MGEHREHREHGKDGKHQPDEHSFSDSKHSFCQPDDSKHSFLRHLWRRSKNYNIQENMIPGQKVQNQLC